MELNKMGEKLGEGQLQIVYELITRENELPPAITAEDVMAALREILSGQKDPPD